MSVKHVGPSALLLTLFAISVAPAQQSTTAPPPPPPPATAPVPAVAQPVPPPAPASPQLSNWITYTRPDCCYPFGGDGPIKSEIFVRVGPTIPAEGGFFSHTLSTGLAVQGGGRVLLFDAERKSACTLEINLGQFYNHGQHSDRHAFLFNVIVPSANPLQQGQGVRVRSIAVTVASLDRTFASGAIGKEWYIWGSGEGCSNGCGDGNCAGNGRTWRVGIDAGYRWGSAKLETQELPHRDSEIDGPFASVHSDWEWACGCMCFMAGLRGEWSYNFNNILQDQNDSEFMDVSILFTLGVRF